VDTGPANRSAYHQGMVRTAEVAQILRIGYTVRDVQETRIPAEKNANGRDWSYAPYANPAEKQGVATSECRTHGILNGQGK